MTLPEEPSANPPSSPPPAAPPVPEPAAPASSPAVPLLTTEEVRVLGCLIEKQISTPEYYPLTLNALTAACNQKNNRAPLVSYDEATVVRTLDTLRDKRLAALVTTAGSRAPKYKHLFTETIGLDPRDTAILCELMLRGPETPGELRSRAERFARFTDTTEIQQVLDGLAARATGPLVVRLPRQPGQKEARFIHLLAGPPPAVDEEGLPPPEPARVQVNAEHQRLAQLETDVAALRVEVAALGKRLDAFLQQFQ